MQATLGKLQAMLEESEEELAALEAEGRALIADQAAADKQTVNVQQETQACSCCAKRTAVYAHGHEYIFTFG